MQPAHALPGAGFYRERLDPLVEQLLYMTEKRVGEQAEHSGLWQSAPPEWRDIVRPGHPRVAVTGGRNSRHRHLRRLSGRNYP